MAPPLIVRVAGLPASAVQALAGVTVGTELGRLVVAEEALRVARGAAVEALHAGFASAPEALRGFWLEVKRDAWNGRSIARHRDRTEWEDLERLAGSAVEEVLARERQVVRCEAAVQAAFDRDLVAGLAGLRETSRDPAFRRGLALASPEILRALPRLADVGPSPSKRQRRLAVGLLRYVTRAALKLSPYGTLTHVGLLAPGGDVGFGWRGRASTWRTRSLVRIRRSLASQLAFMALRGPAGAEAVRFGPNPTLRPCGDGQARWLRPGRWAPATGPDARRRFIAMQLVERAFPAAVTEWLAAQGPRPQRRRALASSLAELLGQAADSAVIAGWLERLAGLGVLVAESPWSSHEPRLEVAVGAWLGDVAGVREAAAALDAAARSLDGFAAAEDPLEPLSRVRAALDAADDALAAAVGWREGTPARQRWLEPGVYEDTFVSSADEPPFHPVACACPSALGAALADLDPWYRLLRATSPVLDFRRALGGLMARRWPSQAEVDVLSLFAAARPLWQSFEAFRRDPAARAAGPFDPHEDAGAEARRSAHRAVFARLEALVAHRDDGAFLDPSELSSAVRGLDADSAGSADPGPCLFLQPCDPCGERWVLNQLCEGTGRYTSRHLCAMPAESGRALATALARHGWVEHHGGRLGLLDLYAPQAETLNVHPCQTPFVLGLPGERLEPPAGAEAVAIEALRIRREDDGRLSLMDARRRYLPVHLGGTALAFAPPLVRFLALLGPTDVDARPWPRAGRREGGWTLRERLSIGRVVVARRRWRVPIGDLAAELRAAPSHGAGFLAVDRWRRRWRLPAEVFALERVPHPAGEAWKPQFVDLGSPVFSLLFFAVVRSAGDALVLEEALPATCGHPRDAAGVARAAEVQVEPLT